MLLYFIYQKQKAWRSLIKVNIDLESNYEGLNQDLVEALVLEALHFKGVVTDEIILHFVSKSEISSLHARYFQDPSPTDCITFPIDEPGELGTVENPTVLGEIFICPEVAAEYDPNDPLGEISLYIVHGILHLLGFDDQSEEEIKIMRKMESELIDHLRDKNLLLSKLDKIIQEV